MLDGQDVNAVADRLITTALELETLDYEEMKAGIERGHQAILQGKERSLGEFFAEQRLKHGFSRNWPHTEGDNSQDDV